MPGVNASVVATVGRKLFFALIGEKCCLQSRKLDSDSISRYQNIPRFVTHTQNQSQLLVRIWLVTDR